MVSGKKVKVLIDEPLSGAMKIKQMSTLIGFLLCYVLQREHSVAKENTLPYCFSFYCFVSLSPYFWLYHVAGRGRRVERVTQIMNF